MEKTIGIDLGTSNCLAANVLEVLDEFKIECLFDENGQEHFPSVAHFKSKEDVIIGEKALELLPQFPERTVELVKIIMGKEKEIKLNIDRKLHVVSPQEITSYFLHHISSKHRVKKSVVTVPAYFDENQRHATLQAGELAGIKIEELIEEPSAAIMFYLFEKYKDEDNNTFLNERGKNYLVFDFGGGTFDLSIIKMEIDGERNLKPVVLAKGGDSELGGNLIDLELTKYAIEYLELKYEDDFSKEAKKEFDRFLIARTFSSEAKPEIKKFILRLKNTMEHVKIELSDKEKSLIEWGLPQYKNLEIKRDDLEKEILEEKFRNRILQAIEGLFSKLKNKPDISKVILIGGTSKIPYFKQFLIETFPNFKGRIEQPLEFDKAVVKGAAIIGAIRDGLDIPPFGKNRCYNIIPHNLFLEHRGKKEILLEQGTPFPLQKPQTKTFPIQHALETNIQLKLYENYEVYSQKEKRRIKKSREIKKINFYHPIFYTGENVKVQIDVNEYGLFFCKAVHEPSNEWIHFEVEGQFQLTEEEVKRIKGDREKKSVDPGKTGGTKSKWKHQDEAVEKFLDKKNGILEMATGTGKTRTAIKIMQNLIAKGEISSIFINANGNDLLDQWYKEVLEYLPSDYKVFRHYGDHREMADFLNFPHKSILIISREFLADEIGFIKKPVFEKGLIICDEIHGFGSPKMVKNLSGKIKQFAFRLGLSATPEREYDEEGNIFIGQEIGPVIYHFGLKDAIKRGILCEFDYFPLEYELTNEEKQKMAKFIGMFKNPEIPMTEEEFFLLLAKIRKLSIGKIPEFIAFLKENPEILERALIFVETKEYGNKIQEIILDYTPNYHTYYGHDDKKNLFRFSKGELDLLITCKRLSEGIDIKTVNNIILFSSDRGKLQTIQRIGRSLRIDPNNPEKKAKVVDFVCDNQSEIIRSDQERKDWLSSVALTTRGEE